MNSGKYSRLFKRIGLVRIGLVLIPLILISCAGTTAIVSDYCLRDRLMPLDDVVENSATETEILIHNERYECACMTQPEWCE